MQHISSLTHPQVKKWASLRQEASARADHQRVLVQGKKMVEEVARACPLRALIVTKEMSNLTYKAEENYIVTAEIIKKITGVLAPEGIAAVVDLPQESLLESCRWILVLDGVSDPGNVGTLLRSCAAFGWDGVFLLPGSCDPFNDKALRASLGAIFHLHYRHGSYEELLDLQKRLEVPFYGADLAGTPIEELKGQSVSGALLAMGAEAHGLSASIRASSKPLTIPMQPGVDSLNVAVAGGIMLYMLREGGK